MNRESRSFDAQAIRVEFLENDRADRRRSNSRSNRFSRSERAAGDRGLTQFGCSDRTTLGGLASYCTPRNKVKLGFVEGLNNKIRVMQRRAYGYRDEEYLRLKILTAFLPRQ